MMFDVDLQITFFKLLKAKKINSSKKAFWNVKLC